MRKSGVLMHISSLPSRHGIGTLGGCAYEFIDFLKRAGQSYWQMLPVGPTGYGNSPYQSLSTFAGGENYIDLDILKDEGLLTEDEINSFDFGDNRDKVDYVKLHKSRTKVLGLAYARFREEVPAQFSRFVLRESWWLEDYALYMSVKELHVSTPYTDWYAPVRRRESGALDACREQYAEKMDFYRFLQFKFFEQWEKLHSYAKEKGVRLIGDIPIYVPLDSCDTWASGEMFQLDENGIPTEVAGCPPDAFGEDGQKWGNPLYDWERMREDGYSWWISRLRRAADMFDVIRLDHFRGFESYWAVPAGDSTARGGRWRRGPGIDFINAIKSAFPSVQFIAEDLGFLTDEVRELQKISGFPSMKVLEFAFDPREAGAYLPYSYEKNSVCYPATHDNAPLCEWEGELDADSLAFARDYLNVPSGDTLARAVIRCGMGSPSNLFICQMQDYLELGSEGRMNTPGAVKEDNWCWRVREEALTPSLAQRMRHLTSLYGRI